MVCGLHRIAAFCSIGRDPSACMSQYTAVLPIWREKDIANPIATILSAAMMLRYSFRTFGGGGCVEAAVKEFLQEATALRIS